MAKTTIMDKAAVITSGIKFEDLKMVSKYRPRDLNLYGGDNGKDFLFGVGVGKCPVVNENGVTFDHADANGYAVITIFLGDVAGDAKEFVAENYGSALMNLNKVEEHLPEVIAQIAGQRQAVLDSINVAQ